MNAPFFSPWLTAEEAAEYLRLPSTKALYQRVRRGDIKPRHLGERGHKSKGALRFHRDDLDAAMKEV